MVMKAVVKEVATAVGTKEVMTAAMGWEEVMEGEREAVGWVAEAMVVGTAVGTEEAAKAKAVVTRAVAMEGETVAAVMEAVLKEFATAVAMEEAARAAGAKAAGVRAAVAALGARVAVGLGRVGVQLVAPGAAQAGGWRRRRRWRRGRWRAVSPCRCGRQRRGWWQGRQRRRRAQPPLLLACRADPRVTTQADEDEARAVAHRRFRHVLGQRATQHDGRGAGTCVDAQRRMGCDVRLTSGEEMRGDGQADGPG
mmetsp:Transcript_47170/g.124396  ORF Transcript_47170/g.124396 Transcript_47170/m.124396 type:complete len:253 (+) Transcript_47170:167-925(+)